MLHMLKAEDRNQKMNKRTNKGCSQILHPRVILSSGNREHLSPHRLPMVCKGTKRGHSVDLDPSSLSKAVFFVSIPQFIHQTPPPSAGKLLFLCYAIKYKWTILRVTGQITSLSIYKKGPIGLSNPSMPAACRYPLWNN